MGTAEWFLPRVTPAVALQEPGPREALPADLTAVSQAVGQHVHGQGGHAHVQLVADMAGTSRVSGQSLVRLLVAGQVGAGGEILTTLNTLKPCAFRLVQPCSPIVVKKGVLCE